MGPQMDPKWGQNSLEINWKFGFEMDSEWSQSGAKMEPKWSKKASQNRAKMELKIDLTIDLIFILFSVDSYSSNGPHGPHMETKWNHSGAQMQRNLLETDPRNGPFHFDLIWAFLGCVFGSIQIVLDSSFTIVGSPFWESCLVPLWVPIGCVLLPFFGCHFWVPFTVRPSLSSDTLLFFFVSMGPRRS